MLDRTGAAPSDFADYMLHSVDPSDAYWRAQRFLDDADRFHTPTLHVTGPLERGGSGFDNFGLFRKNATTDTARDHQHLWFTPAMHSRYAICQADTRSGERSLGDTRFPYHRAMIDWLDHWLRDGKPEVRSWPKVRYFPLNLNRWLTADTWPPTDAKPIMLYLRERGALSIEPPGGAESADRFLYDPMDPVPSEPPSTELDLIGGGYADRTAIEQRDDVLVFTGAPLVAPLHLSGPVNATLYLSSSAPDTDLSVVLTEVDAEGRSINITHGMARVRFRQGLDRQIMMQPGEIYPVTIDLWHIAIVIPVGHCLRIEVTSSHFPVFDRNLNTGGNNYTDTHWQVAENIIHHGPAHLSSVELWVRQNGETA